MVAPGAPISEAFDREDLNKSRQKASKRLVKIN